MAIGTTNFPTSLDTADDLVRATNSASTKLTSGINNSVTSIGVTSVALFPSSGIIRINDEIISYTGTSGGNTFTGCSRGFEGTTAASHQNNDNVTLDITAASNNVKNDAIIAIETKLGTGSSTPTANTVMRGTGTGTSAYGQIDNGDVSASAAIAHNKLANMTAGTVMIGNASNVPTATNLTGDVTVSNAGVTAIASGVIVDADINASAGIAPTKLNVGSGVATFLSTPSSANLLAAVTNETGTGALVFNTQPVFASSVGVGGATATTSGAGITFPGTASYSNNANTLDDYEEGTWTPSIRNGTQNRNPGYTFQNGKYTRIGNQVFISGGVLLSSNNTSAPIDNLIITGLPFATPAQPAYAEPTFSFFGGGFPNSGVANARIQIYEGLSIRLWYADNATSSNQVKYDQAVAGSFLIFSGFYDASVT